MLHLLPHSKQTEHTAKNKDNLLYFLGNKQRLIGSSDQISTCFPFSITFKAVGSDNMTYSSERTTCTVLLWCDGHTLAHRGGFGQFAVKLCCCKNKKKQKNLTELCSRPEIPRGDVCLPRRAEAVEQINGEIIVLIRTCQHWTLCSARCIREEKTFKKKKDEW